MRRITSPRKRHRSPLFEALESRRLFTAWVVPAFYSDPGIPTNFGVSASESSPHDTGHTSTWTMTLGALPTHTHLDGFLGVNVIRANANDNTSADTFQLQLDGQTVETDSGVPKWGTPFTFNTSTDGTALNESYGAPHISGTASIALVPTYLLPGDSFQVIEGSVALHTTVLITATHDGDADQNSPKDAVVTFTRDGTPAQALNVYYSINTNGIFDQPANQWTVPYNPDLSGANLATNLVHYPNNTTIFVATIPAGLDHVDVHYTNYVNANAYLAGIDIEDVLWADPNADSTTPELYDGPGTSLSPAVQSAPWESYTALTDPNVPAAQPAVAAAKVHDLRLTINSDGSPLGPKPADYNAWIGQLDDPDAAVRANALAKLKAVCDGGTIAGTTYPSVNFEDALWNAYNDAVANGHAQTEVSLYPLLKKYFPLHVFPIIMQSASGGPNVWAVQVDAPIWNWFNSGSDGNGGWKPWANGDQGGYLDTWATTWNDLVGGNGAAVAGADFPNIAGHTDGTGNAADEYAVVIVKPVFTGLGGLTFAASVFDANGSDILRTTISDTTLSFYVNKA
jgi:hypothetical protein